METIQLMVINFCISQILLFAIVCYWVWRSKKFFRMTEESITTDVTSIYAHIRKMLKLCGLLRDIPEYKSASDEERCGNINEIIEKRLSDLEKDFKNKLMIQFDRVSAQNKVISNLEKDCGLITRLAALASYHDGEFLDTNPPKPQTIFRKRGKK